MKQADNDAIAVRASKDEWLARAAGWELLALAFRFPDEESAGAFAAGEWAAAAAEVSEALSLGWPPSPPCGLMTLDDLRREHTRLFGGFPRPLVEPYEGRWRARRDGEVPLLVVNPHSMDVERFCRRCGLGRPEGLNEPLDHVATECELLMHLSSVAAGIAKPALPETQMPGGGAQEAYASFLAEHGSAWFVEFADAVIREAKSSAYADAGSFLKALASA